MQDVLLALLAKEPAHGYALRSRVQQALGPAGAGLNAGQVHVTLTRLERAGLVAVVRVDQAAGPERKVYALTAAGHERVAGWLAEVSWPRHSLAEVHLELLAAALGWLRSPSSTCVGRLATSALPPSSPSHRRPLSAQVYNHS